MCDCDGDPTDVYESRMHRTCKERKCFECGRAIEIGEVYEYTFVIFRGDHRPYTSHTCAHCVAARDIIAKITGCGCSYAGDLGNTIENDAEYFTGGKLGDHFTLYRLLIGVRDKWQRGGLLMKTPAYRRRQEIAING
jgi:hypothetical protein